jgi:3-dehydroquinate synthase
LIAFGGGVISDIAGFAASVFKRGIPYVSIPTTLLAQVDAAVGGKTAVDLACGKNMAGTFYQPRAVVVDVKLLATLPDDIYRDGLAEVVKYAIIQDRALFELLRRDHQSLMRRETATLTKVVARCLAIKAAIVSRDEKETKSIRTVLNFGHTIAHAIEAASGYAYSHGKAVALGMRVATRIAVHSGACDKKTEQAVTQLLERLRLPVRCAQKKIALRAVMHYLDYDKKRLGATNRFVLPQRIGKVIIKENVPSALIARAVRETIL